jgi:hypothetical protein
MWERAWDSPRRGNEPLAAAPAGAGSSAKGTTALGLACIHDDECRSGRCSSVAGTSGECVCNDDGDCGSGKFCNMGPDLKRNACESLKADNEACALVGGGHQCMSGHCMMSRCYTPGGVAMGGECYFDDACAKGKCSSADNTRGTCVCKDDPDCGAGFWCDAGTDVKRNACKHKLDKGEVCGTVGELGVGHRCKSGDCKISGVSKNLECK